MDGSFRRHSFAAGFWDGVGRCSSCEGLAGASCLRQPLPASGRGEGRVGWVAAGPAAVRFSRRRWEGSRASSAVGCLFLSRCRRRYLRAAKFRICIVVFFARLGRLLI